MGTVDPDIRRIRALRLRAQGLVPGVRDWRTAEDAARGMLAIQAQDGAAARFALSLRAAEHPDDAAVLADLAAGRITRNRSARGTLQITAPEDLHWLSAALVISPPVFERPFTTDAALSPELRYSSWMRLSRNTS